MHPVGFEPTHLSIAELKSAPLDHSGTNASYYMLSLFYPKLLLPHTIINLLYLKFIFSTLLLKIQWRWGVSIPLPLACEANALPYELHPRNIPYFYYIFLLFFLLKMHPVGFEPTHLSIAVLETAPLDHSGTNASLYIFFSLHAVLLSCYFFFFL